MHFDIGSDTPARRWMTRTIGVPFKFMGKTDALSILVEPPKLKSEDEKTLVDAERAAPDPK